MLSTKWWLYLYDNNVFNIQKTVDEEISILAARIELKQPLCTQIWLQPVFVYFVKLDNVQLLACFRVGER